MLSLWLRFFRQIGQEDRQMFILADTKADQAKISLVSLQQRMFSYITLPLRTQS